MSRIEEFKPKLKPGKLTPQGDKVIYELKNTHEQIVLPIELTDLLVMCDGGLNIAQIIEQLYLRKGMVQFKAIYKTIQHLHERHFFEHTGNVSLKTLEQNSTSDHLITFRPLFTKLLGKRILLSSARPNGFYMFALFSIIVSIFSVQTFHKNWFHFNFLNVNGSYLSAALFIFVGASILLNLKNMYKTAMLVLLSGRAYNFGFTFNGFAAYFRANSDSLFLISNRLHLTLFHFSVTLIYFPIVAMTYAIFPNLPHGEYAPQLAAFLFLLDFNPFHESEAKYFVRWLFHDDTINRLSAYMRTRPLFSFLDSNKTQSEHGAQLFFTHTSLGWCAIMIYLLGASVYQNANLAIYALTNSQGAEVLFAVALPFAFSIAALVFSYNILIILKTSFFSFIFSAARTKLSRKHSVKIKNYNEKEILNTLKTLPLFNYLSGELLTMVVTRSELKEYAAGSTVITQGENGTHLYVLLNGELSVEKNTPSGHTQLIGSILPISLFGEIALLEETPRLANIKADCPSIVLEIPAKMLRQIADDNLHAHEVESFKSAILVNQFFTSAPVFRELSQSVIDYFSAKGKIESYPKGKTIFSQGDPADGFYLILRGSVLVEINNKSISCIKQGGFFGEIAMIADVNRTATIIAEEPTMVLKISRTAFWEIIALDLNMAMFIESVGEMRIREDIEMIRSGKPNAA